MVQKKAIKRKKPAAKKTSPRPRKFKYSGPITGIETALEYLELIGANVEMYDHARDLSYHPLPNIEDPHAIEAVRYLGIAKGERFKPVEETFRPAPLPNGSIPLVVVMEFT